MSKKFCFAEIEAFTFEHCLVHVCAVFVVLSFVLGVELKCISSKCWSKLEQKMSEMLEVISYQISSIWNKGWVVGSVTGLEYIPIGEFVAATTARRRRRGHGPTVVVFMPEWGRRHSQLFRVEGGKVGRKSELGQTLHELIRGQQICPSKEGACWVSWVRW